MWYFGNRFVIGQVWRWKNIKNSFNNHLYRLATFYVYYHLLLLPLAKQVEAEAEANGTSKCRLQKKPQIVFCLSCLNDQNLLCSYTETSNILCKYTYISATIFIIEQTLKYKCFSTTPWFLKYRRKALLIRVQQLSNTFSTGAKRC